MTHSLSVVILSKFTQPDFLSCLVQYLKLSQPSCCQSSLAISSFPYKCVPTHSIHFEALFAAGWRVVCFTNLSQTVLPDCFELEGTLTHAELEVRGRQYHKLHIGKRYFFKFSYLCNHCITFCCISMWVRRIINFDRVLSVCYLAIFHL